MTPDSIDRYQIIEELGRGGMATVYKAHDPLFEREVALKVLPPAFSRDAQFRARFIREARTIAALEHPAIVPVYDYGESYNQPYLVMRYMPGGSLSDRLQQGATSWRETAVILKRIGSALDAAHEKGLIHRDLKPANILFDQYGDAYLADFGIVHVAASDEALTATGSLIGTPSYMSPEQVQGDQELDGRSDIYALGVVLYQMLTGHVPYAADTPVKTMMQHVMEPVPRLLDARPDLPPQFETIISKAMAKERDGRYPTGSDLAEAFNAIVAQSETAVADAIPSTATTPPPTPVTPEPTPRPQPEPVTPPPPQRRPSKPVVKPAPAKAAPPRPITPRPTGGGRRLPPIFWAGIGLLLILCLGVIGAVGWLTVNVNNASSGVIVEDSPSAVTVEVMPEPTEIVVDVSGTATSAALLATREQLALDAVSTSSTATVSPSPTSDARESALATRQALAATATAAAMPVIERPSSGLTPLFGPASGDMPHDNDDSIESSYAAASPADFIMRATFENPFAASENPWDIGLIFRQTGADDEMRLVVHSDGFWNLNDRRGSEDNFVQEADTDLLDVSAGGHNDLFVAALGERGYFFLNGRFIALLDLSSRTEAGDIALGTGFYGSSERVGATTSFSDLTVWPGQALFGPESGGMEHINDGFVKDYSSDVNIYNFIAAAELGSPYPTSEGPWDIGLSFRDADVGEQFWLIIESSGAWSFFDRQANEDVLLDEGTAANLDASDSGANRLLLIALDDAWIFFLNDELIARLDLSSRANAGDVSVVTAFFEGDEIEGNTTTFTDFTVWPLP